MTSIIRLTAIVLLLVIPAGCAWFQSSVDEKTAEQLVEEGMTAFEDGKYRRAIETFQQLKDWYPFSKYAILAELKLADAHFELKEYEEAIYAYEEFERLHPRNEAVPYVIYRIGSSYIAQMNSIDRDQTAVRKALDTDRRLVRMFPDDPYAEKARNRIKTCQKNLAAHEFYVGMFYYKNDHYAPAMDRFKTVLSDYPDVGIHQKALEYIARCQVQLNEE
ncbi:MAG: outer membrane protein assembly factor BamD [Desulfococcaceae bacterium]